MIVSKTGVLVTCLPGLAIGLTTLAGALPWGALASGSAPTTSAGVMLPLAVVHACGLWRTGQTPSWVVFSAGLLADAVTAGPLGYWPLMYLLGLALARNIANREPAPSLATGWLTFAGAAALVGCAAWAVSSLYQLQLISWRALAWPVAITIAAFPVLAGGLVLAGRWIDGHGALRGAAGE